MSRTFIFAADLQVLPADLRHLFDYAVGTQRQEGQAALTKNTTNGLLHLTGKLFTLASVFLQVNHPPCKLPHTLLPCPRKNIHIIS